MLRDLADKLRGEENSKAAADAVDRIAPYDLYAVLRVIADLELPAGVWNATLSQ